MVLRCKGFSQETQDSALKEVAQEEVDSPLNSVKNDYQSQKDASKSEGKKATSIKRAHERVNFILIIRSNSYVNGVQLFVKKIDGVESVKGDSNSIRLEVSGKVDPLQIQEMVEHETKQKVELIFPSSGMEGDRDQYKGSEAKLKKGIKMIHGDGIANKKSKESLLHLKIKLCCESCNQKLQQMLKTKGLETVKMDVVKDLVTVKGTVDVTELRSYFKNKLKKDIEIVVAVRKDKGASNKKEKHAGDITKQEKDVGATYKAEDKDAGAAHKADKGSTTVDEKYIGTAKVDQKYKGTKKVVEKYKGSATVNGKYKSTTTVDEKDKGRAAMDEKNKGTDSSAIDEKDKGIAATEKRDKDRDKDVRVNTEKERDSGGEKKYKASDTGGSERGEGRDGVGNKEENAITYNRYDDNAYGYWHWWHTAKDSNGFDQMFSDENPHSCSVM